MLYNAALLKSGVNYMVIKEKNPILNKKFYKKRKNFFAILY